MLIPEIFRTERLILRVPVETDAEQIFRVYARDREVTRFLTWTPLSELDAVQSGTARRISRHRSGTELSWIIESASTGALMGMLIARPNGLFLEFGYVLGRAFWHQGFMVEALSTVATWALTQPQIVRLWAFCDMENRTSARVLEKAGFSREGILRRWAVHPNISQEPRDCLYYAKTRQRN
jgi:ribosomal-protein-alanine N-acetyltransferase